MSGNIRVLVCTLIPTKSSFTWFSMEVAEAASIEECYRQLVEHGVIRGERFHLDRDLPGGDGVRTVSRREPIIVGRGIIATLAPIPFELKEDQP